MGPDTGLNYPMLPQPTDTVTQFTQGHDQQLLHIRWFFGEYYRNPLHDQADQCLAVL
jgi:hypothetical protein